MLFTVGITIKIVQVTMPKTLPPVGAKTNKTKCVNTNQLAPVNTTAKSAPVILTNK